MSAKKFAIGLGALSLVAAPAMAQAAMAPALAPLTGEENSVGGESIVIGVVAAAAIIGGIILIADDNDNQVPVSA